MVVTDVETVLSEKQMDGNISKQRNSLMGILTHFVAISIYTEALPHSLQTPQWGSSAGLIKFGGGMNKNDLE